MTAAGASILRDTSTGSDISQRLPLRNRHVGLHRTILYVPESDGLPLGDHIGGNNGPE